MTVYVFDSGPLIDLFRHYYPKRFPSLWEQFDGMIADDRITSTREVYRELEGHGDELSEWCKKHRDVFATPQAAELNVVRDIFAIPHFQALIRKKERLQGRPVADPFVIARAKCMEPNACVVTTEKLKPNSSHIPNVCAPFGVGCTDLEGFMERENWSF